ncbi:hypothetical protein ACROYT_G007872 [Oculina patagonica]
MEIATFRLHTASLHQAIRSTGCALAYKAHGCAVIGWFSTALIGAFRSSVFCMLAYCCSLGGPQSYSSPVVVFLCVCVFFFFANLYMESFEEQAIASSSYKPKIWKRYVDDTFTILDRKNVDSFLQHLNNQQPSIRFTMETESDSKLAFLDTAVLREPDGRLTTSIYRKPTHTDQYLAYDSHHPQSVKRGIVKCLYERAKRLVTKPSVISKEKKHLSSVLKITKTRKLNTSAEPVAEFKSTAVLPYVKGLSEQLRRCLQQQGVRAVFKIPCECGKVYIGETGRPMQDRIKEHDRDIRLARTQTSAVAEHTNNTGHYPLWNEVKLIDRDSHWYTRRVKEAIHIRLHPNNINRDSGIEIPEAWMPTIKKHNNRRTVRLRTAEGATVHQHAEH